MTKRCNQCINARLNFMFATELTMEISVTINGGKVSPLKVELTRNVI
jgi:hypothetical protein